MVAKKKEKVVLTKGKKKTAIARTRIKAGKGTMKVNGKSIDSVTPVYVRKIMMEPIVLAEDVLGKGFSSALNIGINVKGGGSVGQAYACRTALGKALVKWNDNEDLKKKFLEYDRTLLIDDVRVKEAKKFLKKGARAKPIKSYR